MLSEQQKEMVSNNRQLADDVQQQRQRVVELENERAKQAALMEFKRQQLELESAQQRLEIEQQRQRMEQQRMEFEKQQQEMERQRQELEKQQLQMEQKAEELNQQKLQAAKELQQRLKKEEEQEQLLRQQQQQRLKEEEEKRLRQQQPDEQKQHAPAGAQDRLNAKKKEIAALKHERDLLHNKRSNLKYSAALATGEKLMELKLEIKELGSLVNQRNVTISNAEKEILALEKEFSDAIRRGSGRGKNIVSLVFSYFIVSNYSSFLLGELRGRARGEERRGSARGEQEAPL